MTVLLLSPQPHHFDRGEPQNRIIARSMGKRENSCSERPPPQSESASHQVRRRSYAHMHGQHAGE